MQIDFENVNIDLKRALFGGALAALITAAGAYLVGHLSGAEAKALLEASLPNTRQLCNTVILASATILALMLTLLSLSAASESRLKESHYHRVRQIAFIDSVVLVAAMVVYLVLNLPIVASQNVPGEWYDAIYYTTLGTASLLGGALVSIVLLIYNTVRDIIAILKGGDAPIAAEEAGSDE